MSERAAKRARSPTFVLPELVARLGSPVDSPEGYAARVLQMLLHAQILADAGNQDEAMATAISIGRLIGEIAMKAVWENEAQIGLKQIQAGRIGNERRFGSEANRATHHKVYAAAVREELAAAPSSRME